MILLYVLYIKDHFNKEWYEIKAFSQHRSELYAWIEANWIQYRNGKVPIVEFEGYFYRRYEKGDFS